jgi:hypothetical protein
MGDEERKIWSFSCLKDASSFLRDLLLTAVLAICLLNPSSIKKFLNESGLSKLGVFGITVEVKDEEAKFVAAQEKISAQVIASAPAAPDEVPVESFNKPVNREFKQTILEVARIAPQILPTAGWVFLGRVNNNKSQWEGGVSSTTTASWPISRNDVITVKDDVYIRAIISDKSYASAPIATISKIGDRLKVVDLQYSPAKAGGFFVWAKISFQSN